MPFVSNIEPKNAPPEVKRIYDAGEKQRGFVMNTWKMIAHSPTIYRAYGQFLGAINNPTELKKSTLEVGILKSSLLNSCVY